MRRRFRFEHGEREYGVFGQFDQGFSVVELAPGGAGDMKVLATVRGVESAEQLRQELEKRFPDLTGFRPF
jgi:hypothetical protein